VRGGNSDRAGSCVFAVTNPQKPPTNETVREGFEPIFGFGLIPCALLCIVSAERLALNEDYRNKGNSERCLDFARHDKKLTGSTNLPSMKLPIWNALVRIREFKRSTSNAEV
jgi:hypothetical protein